MGRPGQRLKAAESIPNSALVAVGKRLGVVVVAQALDESEVLVRVGDRPGDYHLLPRLSRARRVAAGRQTVNTAGLGLLGLAGKACAWFGRAGALVVGAMSALPSLGPPS